MFLIKQISDKRLAERISGSFGVDASEAIVYGAFKNDDVLATAVFLKEEDCMVFHDVDTGRRMDADLADGLARAAFNVGMRTWAKRGKLGENLPKELCLALTKRGYAADTSFALEGFFAKKKCGR